MPLFKLPATFHLENGEVIKNAHLAYTISGSLTDDKELIWICHAFTGSATVEEWWPSLFKSHGGFLDEEKHVIVCANMLGSCYGSSGPTEEESFPQLTNRDVINSFDLLRQYLNINSIDLLIGGSLGGQQALEWSILKPSIIKNQVLIATNAKHSPWGIAFNHLQRTALQLVNDNGIQADKAISLARGIAMLSYRSYEDFSENQQGVDKDELWKIATYLEYQGQKFSRRFKRESYFLLTKMMDLHDVSRNRKDGLFSVLQTITAKTLVIGIDHDQLFPLIEQEFLAKSIKNSDFKIIHNQKGHDAFLTEGNPIGQYISEYFYKEYTYENC